MKENETLTEFNSNVATLIRIDEGLKDAREAAFNGDLLSWFNHLKFLRKECLVKVEHKKDRKSKKCKKNCIKCDFIKRYNKLKDMRVLYRNHPDKFAIENRFDDLLDDFEIFMRDIMNAKGMLLRDESTMDETPEEW